MPEARSVLLFHDAYAARIELEHRDVDRPDMASGKIRAAELMFYNAGDEPMSLTLDEESARALSAALVDGFGRTTGETQGDVIVHAASIERALDAQGLVAHGWREGYAIGRDDEAQDLPLRENPYGATVITSEPCPPDCKVSPAVPDEDEQTCPGGC